MGERHSEYARHKDDFYVEPRWCVEALKAAEPFDNHVWDPACGSGTIPEVFRGDGIRVSATDIVDRGYLHFAGCVDFLAPMLHALPTVSNIISNPPYKLTEAFARRALELARHKVALLTNIKFLASQKRHRLFTETPVRRVWIMSSRPSMPPGDALQNGTVKVGNGSLDFCWVVWEQGYTGAPEIGWLLRPKEASNA